MEPKDVTAELIVSQELLGGTSPAGATVSIRVTSQGLFHTGGLGGIGQENAPLEPEHVARMIVESFDGPRVGMLLAQIERVRDALARLAPHA